MSQKFLATILVLMIFPLPSQALAFTHSYNDKSLPSYSISKEIEVSSITSTNNVDNIDTEGKSVFEFAQTTATKHPGLVISLSNAVHIAIFVSIFMLLCATTVIFLVKSGR